MSMWESIKFRLRLFWDGYRASYVNVLKDSMFDSFDYMLQLKNGTVIRFTEAKKHGGGWTHLDGITEFTSLVRTGHETGTWSDRNFDRGIDVRTSEISWIAKAPHGS